MKGNPLDNETLTSTLRSEGAKDKASNTRMKYVHIKDKKNRIGRWRMGREGRVDAHPGRAGEEARERIASSMYPGN